MRKSSGSIYRTGKRSLGTKSGFFLKTLTSEPNEEGGGGEQVGGESDNVKQEVKENDIVEEESEGKGRKEGG